MDYTNLGNGLGTTNLGSGLGTLIGGSFAFLVLLIPLLIVILAAAYIVQSLAIKKALTFYGFEKSWAAWIPIYRTMCLVECIDTDAEGMITIFGKPFKRDYFKWYPVVSILLSILGIPAVIINIINMVLNFVLFKHLYEQESGKDETGLSVISAIVGIVWIVMCFTRFKGERWKDAKPEKQTENTQE